MDDFKLFDKGVKGVERDDAYHIWERVSQRYAENASGSSIGILNDPSSTSIFNRIEFPTLQINTKTTNVITGGK